ncbi:MAG TPA: glycosyltransferase [Acidimicrobiia bacterium]|nr:glycosyltransferase [Acidimicrobiia bacterium]
MPPPTAVLLSYRLGGADGVAVEAAKWEWALRELGFATRRVAGRFDDDGRAEDTLWEFLAIDAGGSRIDRDGLVRTLADADLIVAENICSLPLNPVAATTAAEVLDEVSGRVVLHHHDLPWERPEYADRSDFPPAIPGAVHVAISDHAGRELARRGFAAHTVRNAFDPAPPAGDATETRRRFGLSGSDVVLLQPTRAIPRKQVSVGLELAARLAAAMPDRSLRYWLTGPAEDGYGPALERLLADAAVPVVTGRAGRAVDAYAAADLVVMPSSWEGFGNPVAEAMLAKRPVACAAYPVLEELLDLGLEVLPVDDPARVADFLRHPNSAVLDRNRAVVGRELSLRDLPHRLAALFAQVGWTDW